MTIEVHGRNEDFISLNIFDFSYAQSGYTGKLRKLRGGITAWSNEVVPKVPKY